MALPRKACCWLGVLGLAWFTPGQAFGDHFLSRLCTWNEVRLTAKNTPWYLIFPGDPAITEAPQGAMYPTWPGSFPPPQPAWAQQQMTLPTATGMAVNQGYQHSPQGQPSAWTTGTGQRPVYQPVSNSSTSVPSYWFAR
jgi:hypothetical protein